MVIVCGHIENKSVTANGDRIRIVINNSLNNAG